MAAICGLEHIPKEKRNPLALTTQGVGELIVHLVQSGIREFIIGVGGSLPMMVVLVWHMDWGIVL